MKKTILALALLSLLALGGQAFAVMGAIDNVPAATLLLPVFLVDVSSEGCATGSGVTTLFAVGNSSAETTIAHVTVWSDLSVPVLDFDIYLTGWDIQTLNLRDVICNGDLPQTGFAVSPRNIQKSGPHIAFPGCNNTTVRGEGPNYADPAFTFTAHIQAWLTGNPSPITGNCAGSGFTGDDLAIGYVTVDDVADCNQFFPSDQNVVAYFQDGGLGFATNQNTLWGDYFYVDNQNNFAQGDALVHIEAQGSIAATSVGSVPGFWDPTIDHSFYGRYVAGQAPVDNREPLHSIWNTRYALGGAFDGTTLAVWREGSALATPFTCTAANVFLRQWDLVQDGEFSFDGTPGSMIFDETEQSIAVTEPVSGDPTPDTPIDIPNEANWVDVGTSIPTPFSFGWLMLNLRHSGIAYDLHPTHGGLADDYAQNYVSTIFSAAGRFSAGWDANHSDNIFFAPIGGHTPPAP
jgi:hypothetical protein